MTDQDGMTHRNAESAAVASNDEISLFDIWNVLVRRKWVVFAVFALALVSSTAFALTRPTVYQLSQIIEVGRVETRTLPDDAARFFRENEFFPSPVTTATEISELYLPSARDQLSEGGALTATQDYSVNVTPISDSRLIRLSADAATSRIDQYEALISAAAERASNAHAEMKDAVRQQLEDFIMRAQNSAEELQGRIESKQGALERMATRKDLITAEIGELEEALKRAEAARANATEGQPDAAQATTVLLMTNEMRKARQDMSDLREQLNIELPGRRKELQNDIEALQRERDRVDSQIERLKNAQGDIRGTRTVSPVKRDDTPVGTSVLVLIALGCVLGTIAGVLAGFFAEFVASARAARH